MALTTNEDHAVQDTMQHLNHAVHRFFMASSVPQVQERAFECFGHLKRGREALEQFFDEFDITQGQFSPRQAAQVARSANHLTQILQRLERQIQPGRFSGEASGLSDLINVVTTFNADVGAWASDLNNRPEFLNPSAESESETPPAPPTKPRLKERIKGATPEQWVTLALFVLVPLVTAGTVGVRYFGPVELFNAPQPIEVADEAASTTDQVEPANPLDQPEPTFDDLLEDDQSLFNSR